jgi:hypothetical protein
MQRILFFILFFFPALFLNAAAITLINNTESDLTAVIRGKGGVLFGEVFVNAFYTKQWTYNPNLYETPPPGGISNYTPLTVSWICMGGKVYSVCEDIFPGMQVTAKDCEGSHWCPPKTEPPGY